MWELYVGVVVVLFVGCGCVIIEGLLQEFYVVVIGFFVFEYVLLFGDVFCCDVFVLFGVVGLWFFCGDLVVLYVLYGFVDVEYFEQQFEWCVMDVDYCFECWCGDWSVFECCDYLFCLFLVGY